MLRINHVSKSFGSRVVLTDVTLMVNEGSVSGVVGANGSGKSTLLRIAAGQILPDAGSVERTPGTTVGLLRQGYARDEAQSLEDVFPGVFARRRIERRIAALSARLASNLPEPESDALDREFASAIAKLEGAPGDDGVRRLRDALHLRDVTPDERFGALSGGEQTKLALIALALAPPDVLLLDEPTNHLDLEGAAWLDSYLVKFAGAVLVVSHDRALLDDHARQIVELDDATHQATSFTGGYSEYTDEKQRLRDSAWDAYRRQRMRDRRVEQEIRDIKATAQRRERSSQNDFYRRKAKKVARRATVLERRLLREQAASDRVEKPIRRPYRLKTEIESVTGGSDRMIFARDLRLGFDGWRLLAVDELSVGQGERIVLAGPNGSGKTTLVRALAGEIEPNAGSVRIGRSTRIGYLPQESLIEAKRGDEVTPVSLVRRAAGVSETEARRFLHRFLFSGDGALTPLARLSYGERRRLALAELVLSGANLLLLDEPTNHLDIPSREAFEDTLATYAGAIVAVTHDRYFIERFAERLLLLEDGRLREVWT